VWLSGVAWAAGLLPHRKSHDARAEPACATC